MFSKQKKVIAIVGPTAIGKTHFACGMAMRFNSHIVSADSRQIFREMTIGVARPDTQQLYQVPHHFIGCRSILSSYSAGQYAREALPLIDHLFTMNDYVILCGGSGLYIKAVCDGLDEVPAVDVAVRKSVIRDYEKQGLSWLQQQVADQDPDFFLETDKQNPRRLMRALELIRSTGKTMHMLRKQKKQHRFFVVIKIGLRIERATLYKNIDARVNFMMERGLEKEARELYPFRNQEALQTVGYKELFHHFDGEYDIERAVSLIKRNTRRYAKRQLTWFERDKEICWFHPTQFENVHQHVITH